MPIYEYVCEKCCSRFDLKRSFCEDVSEAECRECKGKAKRVFTPVPIIFKGSGFYVTDNRSKNPTAEPASESASKPEPAKPDKPGAKKDEKAA